MRQLRFLLSVLLLSLLIGGTASAEKIPQSKAMQFASDFFKQSGHMQQQMAVLKTSEDLSGITTKATTGDPKFYIIGNTGGKGFAIISGDDRFRPVLGYSFENTFDANNIPSNVEYWLDFISRQMDWAVNNNITDPETIVAWQKGATAGQSAKMLNTALWNQGYPYYNECPMDGNERSLTGCVATAICEVMRFHKWPKTGNGVTMAYTGSSGVSVSSRNLNHNYDWDNMPLTTKEYDDETKRQEVAVLMADVGAAIQLNYSSDGTGGTEAHPALWQNFGYRSDALFDQRVQYTDDEWIKMLKNEIDNERPIIYSGQDPNAGGHCFVLDGYDNNNYFYVNWGWGGSDNGFYSISALNPSSYKFNSDQDAIFNFEPGDGTVKAPENWMELYEPGLECSTTTFTKNVKFSISKFRVTNTSLMDFAGNLALFLTDKEGNKIEQLYLAYCDFPAATYLYMGSSPSVTITKDIKEGYRIRAFYKSTTQSDWTLMWRDDPGKTMNQEILVAKDIPDPLEDKCSMNIENNTITVTVPSGTTTGFYNGDTEITEGVTKTETSIVIDMSQLSSGTKYRIHLSNGSETKDLNITSKPIEK